MKTPTPKIRVNKAQCAKCSDIIVSVSTHDFKYCKCGTIFVDGGNDYLRRGYGKIGDIIELSEYEPLDR